MYSIFLDQPKNFECKIQLEGASLNSSQARLVMETQGGLNFIFKGNISNDGKVTIPIKKLKNILNEEQSGNLTLEIIADDVYFTPWTSKFETIVSKKVTAIVQESIAPEPSKPKVSVVMDENKPNHLNNILKALTSNKINIFNINENKKKVNTIINDYISKNSVSKNELKDIVVNLPLKLYEVSNK